MDELERDLDPQAPRSRWAFLFSWPSFFVIALVLYELTSEAFLGITALCLKFGWEYFRTAFWLRRQDPDKVRGRMSFWSFMAYGMWKTALVGTILMFTYAGILGPRQPLGPPPREFVEALLVAAFGYLMAGVMTLRALGLALWHGKKMWVDPGIHQARQRDYWPPISNGPNKAWILALTSLFVVGLPLMVVVLAVLLTTGILANPDVAVMSILGVFLTVLPLSILLATDFLRARVLAQYPQECWDRNLIAVDSSEEQLVS